MRMPLNYDQLTDWDLTRWLEWIWDHADNEQENVYVCWTHDGEEVCFVAFKEEKLLLKKMKAGEELEVDEYRVFPERIEVQPIPKSYQLRAVN